MKTVLAILMLASSAAFAQERPTETAVAPGCGSSTDKFEVSVSKGQHQVTQPQPGKALMYVIEDDTQFESWPKPTTRVGVDAKWIGAMHGNSYLYLPLEPGEHHLCVSWQSFVGVGMGRKAAALHFTAEEGKAYYFRVKNIWISGHGRGDIEFVPLDSDEGQLLASKFEFSTSQPKK